MFTFLDCEKSLSGSASLGQAGLRGRGWGGCQGSGVCVGVCVCGFDAAEREQVVVRDVSSWCYHSVPKPFCSCYTGAMEPRSGRS